MIMQNPHVTECESFIAWCKPKLGLDHVKIRVKLINKPIDQTPLNTFGYFDVNTGQICISILDRHPLDVVRTLAHEMVHMAQSQHQDLSNADGATGSQVENEANALAGILLRMYRNRS
jgi:Zn-dependent peptidase ImmA (M78 family)